MSDDNTNPEDDIMARIEDLGDKFDGSALENFTSDISETLRAKYGPGSMSDEPAETHDYLDDLPGGMADMDQERPNKIQEFLASEDSADQVAYGLVAATVAVTAFLNVRAFAKIYKDLKR